MGHCHIFVALMFVDSSISTVNGKAYSRHLLRETYREDGKVKHRTLANLSQCKPEEVEAIRLALKHKGDLPRIVAESGESQTELKQGASIGAVWALYQLARELGLVAALGCDRQGKLALWQVIARVLDQGSRLSSVRLAGGHAVGAALGTTSFDERRPLRQSRLAGRQSGGDRAAVVRSEKGGLRARRLSLRRDQHLSGGRAQRLRRLRLQPRSQVRASGRS